MAGKKAISSASAKLHSDVYVHGVSKGVESFGLIIYDERASNCARYKHLGGGWSNERRW